MRIAVISDTHGSVDLALEAVRRVEPVDAVVHLGDFQHDGIAIAKKTAHPVFAIRGDNDPWEGDKELLLEWEGQKVFATHGHYHDVDSSLDRLVRAAGEKGAKAALFGHDHKPRVEKRDGILIVNPGSLYFIEQRKTFAVLEISPRKINAKIIEFEHQDIKNE